MLWWLVDNATVVYLILGLSALVLAAIFWSNRRVKFLAVAGVLLGFIGLFFIVTRLVVTDRKQLERNILAMVQGVEEGDAGKVFAHFSRDFRHSGLALPEFRERVGRHIQARQVSDIIVTNYDFKKISRVDGAAEVSFFVTFTVGRAEGRPRYRCRLDFALEAEQWRIKGVELFQFGSGQPVAIPL